MTNANFTKALTSKQVDGFTKSYANLANQFKATAVYAMLHTIQYGNPEFLSQLFDNAPRYKKELKLFASKVNEQFKAECDHNLVSIAKGKFKLVQVKGETNPLFQARKSVMGGDITSVPKDLHDSLIDTYSTIYDEAVNVEDEVKETEIIDSAVFMGKQLTNLSKRIRKEYSDTDLFAARMLKIIDSANIDCERHALHVKQAELDAKQQAMTDEALQAAVRA